jgi:hypothetical protein
MVQKKGQTLVEPKVLFLNRRQKRAIEGDELQTMVSCF